MFILLKPYFIRKACYLTTLKRPQNCVFLVNIIFQKRVLYNLNLHTVKLKKYFSKLRLFIILDNDFRQPYFKQE